jgi:hypothetical protein
MITNPKSRDKDPILEQKFFNLLFPIAFPDYVNEETAMKFANKLAFEYGILPQDRLLEVAISVKKNLARYNTEGQDFVDGSDAKTSSVRWSSNRKSYSAPITNVHKKIGLLRCVVYERMLDKFYYFLIPHDAYQHITSTSNIDIPFDVNTHLPRRDVKYRIVNWWDFEVENFDSILADTAAPVIFSEKYQSKTKEVVDIIVDKNQLELF